MRSRVSLVIIVCLALAGSAAAQQTGSISGTVFDATGAPVAGASVRVSGDQLPPAARRRPPIGAPTASRCCWPGSTSSKRRSRGRCTRRTVLVEVDRDTQLDLAIGVSVEEAVVITAVTPIVDIQSTEVNFNFTDQYLQDDPAGAHLSRAVPANPRGRRQPQQRRTRGGRDAPGQRVPDRRRQHHQSWLRLSLHGGERARHRGGKHQASGHLGGVRPHGRSGDERGHAVRHQPPHRHRAHRLAA